MERANADIRAAMKKSQVRQWELADKVGLTPNYFVIKLRHELPEDEKLKLFAMIQEIAEVKKVEKGEMELSVLEKRKRDLEKAIGRLKNGEQ